MILMKLRNYMLSKRLDEQFEKSNVPDEYPDNGSPDPFDTLEKCRFYWANWSKTTPKTKEERRAVEWLKTKLENFELLAKRGL